MKLAKVMSLFLFVLGIWGCAVGDAGDDEPLDQAQSAWIKETVLICIRDRSDLPDGHNIDSWLIACLNHGGSVTCHGDTPMCCNDGHCSDDPSDVVRSDAGDLGGGSSGDTVTQNPGGKNAVGGQIDTPGTLGGISLGDGDLVDLFR